MTEARQGQTLSGLPRKRKGSLTVSAVDSLYKKLTRGPLVILFTLSASFHPGARLSGIYLLEKLYRVVT